MPHPMILNFSSVLEIGFGINFLFLVLELRPIIENKWLKVESHGDAARKALWFRVLEGKESSRVYAAIDSYRIFSIALEVAAFLLTGIASILALGGLIWAGFIPDATLPHDQAVALISLLFIPVPAYVAGNFALLAAAERHFTRLACRLGEDPLGTALAPPTDTKA